jgi:hypothetical protein
MGICAAVGCTYGADASAMSMKEYLNEISELADEGVHSKAIAASRIILGGLDAQPFWGFTFLAFTRRFNTRLQNYLPDPRKAQLNLVPGFNALRDYDDSRVDRISDPVRNVTHDSAESLAGRVTVVGLAGERGSGRGALASHLVDTYSFTRMEFMDPLRVATSVLYNIPMHYFSSPDLLQKRIPQLDMSPEKAMHVIGADICQGLRRSIWNDRLLLRMAAVATLEPTAPPPKIVVSGLRFEDEAQFVRSLPHGRIAWLSRTGCFASAATGAIHADDVLLTNSGGLREFLLDGSRKLGLLAPEAPKAEELHAQESPSSRQAPAARPALRAA